MELWHQRGRSGKGRWSQSSFSREHCDQSPSNHTELKATRKVRRRPKETKLLEAFARVFQEQLPEKLTVTSTSQKVVDCFVRSITKAVANQVASPPRGPIPPDLAAFATLFLVWGYAPFPGTRSASLDSLQRRRPSSTHPSSLHDSRSTPPWISNVDPSSWTIPLPRRLPISAACRGHKKNGLRGLARARTATAPEARVDARRDRAVGLGYAFRLVRGFKRANANLTVRHSCPGTLRP